MPGEPKGSTGEERRPRLGHRHSGPSSDLTEDSEAPCTGEVGAFPWSPPLVTPVTHRKIFGCVSFFPAASQPHCPISDVKASPSACAPDGRRSGGLGRRSDCISRRNCHRRATWEAPLRPEYEPADFGEAQPPGNPHCGQPSPSPLLVQHS